MTIKFKKLISDAFLPQYAHPGDAGLDLHTIVGKILKPDERHDFPTGLSAEIPPGFVGLIWERSSLALKDGLVVIGGVIDSGYRGEIRVALWNLSKKSVKIEKGDRIAQLLIQPVTHVKIKEVKNLSGSLRGKKGFGSSGRK